MAELALRRIQAGFETTRGVAVPATKKIYGTMVPDYKRDSRAAVEDRGTFVKVFRTNHQLVVAGATLTSDATFEDLPWMLSTILAGGVTATGSATTGYTWAFTPDQGTDTIKTATYEMGDESVSWQMPFGWTDEADFAMTLDNALVGTYKLFGKDLIPSAPPVYTGGLPERTVESVMGYQSRLYVDLSGTAVGTTQITGRFISSNMGFKLNSARKTFGDGTPYLSRIGRGRRDMTAQMVFELLDLQQWSQFNSAVPQQLATRLQLIGTGIAGTNLGSTSAALNPGTITSIPVSALAAAVPGGVGISVGGIQFAVTVAGAAAGATAIPVQSQALTTTIASGTTVQAARTQNWDIWGQFQNFSIAARDTNVTQQLTLMGVYDPTAAQEAKVTVVNGLATL